MSAAFKPWHPLGVLLNSVGPTRKCGFGLVEGLEWVLSRSETGRPRLSPVVSAVLHNTTGLHTCTFWLRQCEGIVYRLIQFWGKFGGWGFGHTRKWIESGGGKVWWNRIDKKRVGQGVVGYVKLFEKIMMVDYIWLLRYVILNVSALLSLATSRDMLCNIWVHTPHYRYGSHLLLYLEVWTCYNALPTQGRSSYVRW